MGLLFRISRRPKGLFRSREPELDNQVPSREVEGSGAVPDWSAFEPASPNSVSTEVSRPPHITLEAAGDSSLERLPFPGASVDQVKIHCLSGIVHALKDPARFFCGRYMSDRSIVLLSSAPKGRAGQNKI